MSTLSHSTETTTAVEQYDALSGCWYDSGRDFSTADDAAEYIAAQLLSGDPGRFRLVSTTYVEVSA